MAENCLNYNLWFQTCYELQLLLDVHQFLRWFMENGVKYQFEESIYTLVVLREIFATYISFW